MKKRVLSLILTLAMIATSVCTVFAAPTDLELNGARFKDVVDFFADMTPDSPERRVEILGYIESYIGSGDDKDMDTLLDVLKTGSDEGLPAELQDIFKKVTEKDADGKIYPAAMFTLELIRAIDAKKRQEVIEGFGERVADGRDARVRYEWKEPSAEKTQALKDLYDNSEVYPTKLHDAMEWHTGFGESTADPGKYTEDPELIVLNLFTAWKGTFQFTDDDQDGTGFAFYKIFPDYEKKLNERLGDYTFNGQKIDAATLGNILAEAINQYSPEVKEKMKLILDDDNLDLYVKRSTFDVGVTEMTVTADLTSDEHSMEESFPVSPLSQDEKNPAQVDGVYAPEFTLDVTPYPDGATVTYSVSDGTVDKDGNLVWTKVKAEEDGTLKQPLGPGQTVKVKVEVEKDGNTKTYYVDVTHPAPEVQAEIKDVAGLEDLTELTPDDTVHNGRVLPDTKIDESLKFTPKDSVKPEHGVVGHYSKVKYGYSKDINVKPNQAGVYDGVTFEDTLTQALEDVLGEGVTSLGDEKSGAVIVEVETYMVDEDGNEYLVDTESHVFKLYTDKSLIMDVETTGFETTPEFAPEVNSYGPDTVTSDDGKYQLKLKGVDAESEVTCTIDGKEYPYDPETGVIEGVLDYDDTTRIEVTVKNGEDTSKYTFRLERGSDPNKTPTPTPTPTRSPSSSNSGSSGNRGGRPSYIIPTTDGTIPNPPVSNTVFPDTEFHWAKDYIGNVVDKKLFIGYDDGLFHPNIGITREEMAVVLVRLLNLENELGSAPAPGYLDDAAIAAWAYDSVAVLSARKIYVGYDDDEFKPKRILTREEMIALMMRLYGDSNISTVINYKDAADVGEWARDYVGQGTNLGIIDGHEDGYFRPRNNITRAEAAKVLYNYMYLKGN